MHIFISHISEEKPLAMVIKRWINSSFLGQIEVFVSSDSDDISAGDKWLDKIDNALNDSKVLIILYSHQSKLRPWINFEAGCGWIKKIPVMPICHSDLAVSEIRPPISGFQGLNIDSKDFTKIFFESVAKQAGFSQAPHVPVNEFMSEVKTAISDIGGGIESPKVIENTPTEENTEFSEEQIKIMRWLARCQDAGGDYVKDVNILRALTMKPTILKHHINSLVKKEYVGDWFKSGSMHYSISPKGIDYLVGNGLHK